ncbi:MAG TPA: hypothetical protein VMQ59_04045 [Acidimicrobiales bacterium]|nr:hypothetical protein [Acidimicrobiales bacterium]
MSITRYRCTACGNLTRFDVVTTRTTRAFNHFTVGGDLEVEEEEVLAESVDEVCCRWCGHGRGIEVLADGPEIADGGGADSGSADAAGNSPQRSPVN